MRAVQFEEETEEVSPMGIIGTFPRRGIRVWRGANRGENI